jgi:hypothetical protein
MVAPDPERSSSIISYCRSEGALSPPIKALAEPVTIRSPEPEADMRRREFLGVLGGAATRDVRLLLTRDILREPYQHQG